jgi:hypothetical protein
LAKTIEVRVMTLRPSSIAVLLIASALLVCPHHKRAALAVAPAPAPKPPETKVQKSIREGIAFLRKIEDGKGDFEHTTVVARIRPGGVTALATVSLLKCGVPANDPLVERCLRYLRGVEPAHTYTVGLQTMAFCIAGQKKDRPLVQRNLDWLKENRVDPVAWKIAGWGYDAVVKSPDHSNTFYAILGLAEAHRAGFKIDTDMLDELQLYYQRNEKGAWQYRGAAHPSLTMTGAGLFNLIAVREMLGEKQNAKEKAVTTAALKWLGEHFATQFTNFHPFYCLHTIRCAAERSGQKMLGKHDWRKIGTDYLLAEQQADGSWSGRMGGNFDSWPPVATSFALLFLAGGK